MSISPQQRKAVDYFMRGLSKRQALIEAGYSPSTAQNPHCVFSQEVVKEEIERRQRNLRDKAQVDANWIVRKLKAIAEANIGDIIEIDASDGSLKIDWRNISPELREALGGIDISEYKEGRGKDRKPYTKIQIKQLDKLKALEMLGKYLGMFEDRVKVEGEVTLIEKLHAGRARIAEQKKSQDD